MMAALGRRSCRIGSWARHQASQQPRPAWIDMKETKCLLRNTPVAAYSVEVVSAGLSLGKLPLQRLRSDTGSVETCMKIPFSWPGTTTRLSASSGASGRPVNPLAKRRATGPVPEQQPCCLDTQRTRTLVWSSGSA
jgi:hypothetical protein